jgi:glutamine amidotransferase
MVRIYFSSPIARNRKILKKEVCIVDYGVGNISTLTALVGNAGLTYMVSSDPFEIEDSPILILAGVGAFDYGMSRLNDLGITPVIKKAAEGNNQKIIGICLGMQLLFEGSKEGVLPGLGLISGNCEKFPSEADHIPMRIPHMGWSLIEKSKYPSKLSDKYDLHRFYFVHSYYAEPTNPEVVKYSGEYGIKFPAIIEQGNVMGAQFHPEKSSRQGRALLLEMLRS